MRLRGSFLLFVQFATSFSNLPVNELGFGLYSMHLHQIWPDFNATEI
jgi:hypothetical protein